MLLLTRVAEQDDQERESQMVLENQLFLVDWLFIGVGLARFNCMESILPGDH